MKSQITLTFDIEHSKNLPSAQQIAKSLTEALAKDLLIVSGGYDKTYQLGRRTVTGPEDGDNVSSFLQSAAIEGKSLTAASRSFAEDLSVQSGLNVVFAPDGD